MLAKAYNKMTETGLASYWMGIGSFGGVFSWKGRRRVSEMKLFMYIEIMCVSWCFLRWFLIIFTYLCVMHIVFQELVVFSLLDCFSSALEVVAVLMLIVYVLEALKKICIINKHVESVGEMEEHGTLRIGERNPGRLPLLWRHFLLFIFIIRSTSAFHLHCIRHRDCSFGMFL